MRVSKNGSKLTILNNKIILDELFDRSYIKIIVMVRLFYCNKEQNI